MNLRKILTLALIICVSLSATSCMNFLESIFFKADGSGTYTFTIDMNGLKPMLDMAGEDFSSEEILKEVNMDENETIQKLEAIKGISNAATLFNEDDFTASISFDFANVDALNEGMSTYLADSTQTEIEMIDYFTVSKKTISRANVNKFLDVFNESIKEGAEAEGMDLAMVKMMLGDLFYSSEIKTERTIKSFSNEAYNKQDDNIIIWKFYPFKSNNNSANVGVTLKTK